MQRMNSFIPLSRAWCTGEELDYLRQAIGQHHLSGDGPFTRRVHALLKDTLGVHKALLTTSGSHALEMSALLLGIQPGDEVIVPSFTFVTSASAFALRGARPVFIDIRPDTLNLDETQLERLITARTKAIVPVHYSGVGCEMDAILAVAQRSGIAVVEDNAHGLFARYRGKPLGSFGGLAVLSFHATKNFTCGEGGALLINDPQYAELAEIIREKGTDRSRFLRGQVDKYTWVALGSSYLPSELQAAFLCAQLEARECIQQKRRNVWEYYRRNLGDWALEHQVRLPVVPGHCEHSYHSFYLLMPSLESRQALIAHLKDRNIASAFHYVPLHLSAMGQRLGGKEADCPVTEKVSDQLLRLPLYAGLTEEEQARVIRAIREFPWRQTA